MTQTPLETETNQQSNNIPVVPSLSFPLISKPKPFFSGSMPVPPSTNHAYMIVRTKSGSRVGPTDQLTVFKEGAALMLSQAYHDWSLINAIRTSKRKVPLSVKIDAYFSSEWKRDLDGIIKFSTDAAFERIQLNDNQVVSVQAEKHVAVDEPRVEIEISVVVR